MPNFSVGKHDFPKADANGGLQRPAKLPTECRQHLCLNGERGANRAERIVAVGHGRAKHRQHRVADVALDHAAKGMHDRGDALGVAAHDGVQVFGIDFGRKPGEIGQVGEQDGDITAFAHRPDCG